MHRVLRAHLTEFAKSRGLEDEKETDAFEAFVACLAASHHYAGHVDLDEVVTRDGEVGIDGCAAFFDGEYVCSEDHARDLLTKKRNVRVAFLFTQAKTSDGFDLGDILKFGSAVKDFFTQDAGYSQEAVISRNRAIYSQVEKHIGRIANGRPEAALYFASAGEWHGDPTLQAGILQICTNLDRSGFVHATAFEPMDRDRLISCWTALRRPVEATLDVTQYMPIPAMANVKEAYLAIASAQNLVRTVLSDAEGRLRTYIFEQNVRSFLGEDNDVNTHIRSTLEHSELHDRFAILNNGLTIVAPDVRISSNRIHMKQFQVVNGCQTSHVLFNNASNLSDRVFVPIKVICAQDEDVVAQVVEATNSQSQINRTQFLSIRPYLRRLENFFNTFSDDSESERRLYFERRDRQFAGNDDIPEVRVFDIASLARAFAAMFLDRPDLSSRYPSRIFEELRDHIYRDDDAEIAYYTAALAAYRMQLLFNNRLLDASFRARKWHLLMVLKYQVGGVKPPFMNAGKMQAYCKRILDVVSLRGRGSLDSFKEATKLLARLGRVTDDQLKRRPYIEQIHKAVGRTPS